MDSFFVSAFFFQLSPQSPHTPGDAVYRRPHILSGFLSPQAPSPSPLLLARRNELRVLLELKEQQINGSNGMPVASSASESRDIDSGENSMSAEESELEDMGLRPHQPSGSGDAPVMPS